ADEIEARVGAFVGTNWGHYKARYLASSANQDKVQRFGELNTAIANEQDFPATRLAYLFNFRGPCINLLTACSTGLVGVCQGVNSLLNFESDYVVAGGVSLDPPSNRGYLYNEGGMLSKDGYTRPFDSEASGTTFNEGGALVLLKRLEDAVADKDTIHAVILGCATNNDGNKKVSFTAPSVDGQSDALKLALTVSDVDPGAVTHIETHGTATPLGDPIEVAAIKSAYGKEDAPPCYLGSLKGNVGHMIHAAGTGSLIKMALSLRDGVIPPVAHFKSANPNLKLERSRFSVNPEPVRWHDNEADALFGAVSSFGVGGTNAHAVLRSWNDDRPSDADTAVPVALISADSEESLHTLAGRLAESVDPADWPDAAYTLLKGRKRLAHRGSLALPEKGADGPASGTMLLAGAAKAVSEVVFLFPGQGAQWPGMAAGLKEGLPEVARDVERCIDATGPLKESLRYLLFEADPQDSEAAEQLRQTSLTQPALFAMSYAVGRYWLRRGVVPSKMIGHSVGEFAAACLAGVWDLETTVAAVCRRAQLMQNAAPGAMLAVRLGVSELDPLLKDSGLALAVVNGPESAVVGGDDASVEAFSASLKRQGIASQRLVTSHAFHTASMSDAAEAFLEYLNGVSFDEPQYTI
ncbi:MAG: type I polyketide synthase, partial [Pseudomonadota bacterium]